MSTQSLRTLAEARAWLERHGVSASEWARVHGFEPTVVLSVLSGRTRGRRGQAHAVAVALQVKEAVSKCESSPLALSGNEDGTESRRAVPLSESKGATMT